MISVGYFSMALPVGYFQWHYLSQLPLFLWCTLVNNLPLCVWGGGGCQSHILYSGIYVYTFGII